MSDQEVRRAVLEAMNKRRKEARHEHEIRTHITQIERELSRAGYDLEDEQIMQAVDYLYAAKMLKRIQETKTVKLQSSTRSRFRTGNSSFKHTNYYYTLTAKAMDELDGETEYSKQPFVPFQSIHITTSNAPVVIGSKNHVSNNVTVFNQLDELEQIITESDSLSVKDRQDAASDIESLKPQLAKPNPNKAVVDLLWKNIGRVADTAGASAFAVEVAKAIAAMTGHPIG
jgi:hypothetical protein